MNAGTTDDPGNPIKVNNSEGDETRFTRSVTVTPNTPSGRLCPGRRDRELGPTQGGVRQVQLTYREEDQLAMKSELRSGGRASHSSS